MSRRRTTPTLRQRRLARELRQHREAAKVKSADAAAAIDLKQASLSRIENAAQGIRSPAVDTLLRLYGASDEQRLALVKLAREARQTGWWHAYRDVLSSETSAYLDFESEAISIRTFEVQYVPGLFQTHDYARTVIAANSVGVRDEDVDRAAEARARRAKRLVADPPLEIAAIIDETALRRRTGGPKVMADQLRHLLDLAARTGITVQVLPATGIVHPAVGAFSLLEFPAPEDPDVVYTDTIGGELYLEDPGDVRRCTILFDRLRAAALASEPSANLITHIAEELDRER